MAELDPAEAVADIRTHGLYNAEAAAGDESRALAAAVAGPLAHIAKAAAPANQ
jgi:hypothetical protein